MRCARIIVYIIATTAEAATEKDRRDRNGRRVSGIVTVVTVVIVVIVVAAARALKAFAGHDEYKAEPTRQRSFRPVLPVADICFGVRPRRCDRPGLERRAVELGNVQ